jgi:spore protease
VGEVLEGEINNIIGKLGIDKNDSCLIIGLGNRDSTADSLGPKTIDKVMVTRHLFLLNTSVKEGIRCVSTISPGVMANTGIESYDIITSLVAKIKPDFLIAIDALASSSIDRINKTIQLTDTGIHPGSGVGNNRKEISRDTVGIPVIAIGVPTVVESSIIVNDTITYLFKHLSYIKNNYKMNKLVLNYNKRYLDNKSDDLTKDEKRVVSGMLGELTEEEKIDLIEEVLTNLDYNLIVTPKEIDFLIDKLSDLIARSINKSLNEAV